LTNEVFNDFKTAVTCSVKRVNKKKLTIPERKINNLTDFMKSFKKGSRPIRKIFEAVRNKNVKIKNRTNVKTFYRLIDVPIPDPDVIIQTNQQWSCNFYPNKVRDFIFKFYNNQLGLNIRVAHFNRDVERGCTFCRITNRLPVPDENFEHIFFSCDSTSSVRLNFIRTYLFDLNLDDGNAQSSFS
jgi:hypothetical protein